MSLHGWMGMKRCSRCNIRIAGRHDVRNAGTSSEESICETCLDIEASEDPKYVARAQSADIG